MNKKISIISFLIVSVLLTGCGTTKIIKFTKKKDETFSNSVLSNFLLKHKNPKIVLRVEKNNFKYPEVVSIRNSIITHKEDNSYLYQAIENKLLSNNFIVRDRQLFNQTVDNEKKKNNFDYEKIGKKTDTDLILELVKIDTSVLYATNKYYDSKNKQKLEKDGQYERYGASVEFKVILIKNNQFAGSYKFNYTPCTKGCVVSKSLKDIRKEKEQMKIFGKIPYQAVEKNVLVEFIQNATQRLINEMRK